MSGSFDGGGREPRDVHREVLDLALGVALLVVAGRRLVTVGGLADWTEPVAGVRVRGAVAFFAVDRPGAVHADQALPAVGVLIEGDLPGAAGAAGRESLAVVAPSAARFGWLRAGDGDAVAGLEVHGELVQGPGLDGAEVVDLGAEPLEADAFQRGEGVVERGHGAPSVGAGPGG